MAEGRSRWGLHTWLIVIASILIAATLVLQQQHVDRAADSGPPPRNTIYVNSRGEVVAADTTFQVCQRQCASICDPEYPYIQECLQRQSDCTYRCEADRR